MDIPMQWNASSLRRKHGQDPVLSLRALNRALLERQYLLRRVNLSVIEVIEHLVGLQAQAPIPPYFGLWTRLSEFRHEDLSQLIKDRKVVRIILMRGTIHLVSARDCLALRPLLQPVLDRWLKGVLSRQLEGLDIETLALASRTLVEEQPRTFSELRSLLSEQWPDHPPDALADVVRALVPLVQVPPRGIWGASGQATHTSAEAWLGRPLTADAKLDDMILRYLAAFGPATIKDMQVWSGLTGLREVVERLRPHLRTFRDENGSELLDLPDAPLPSVDTPAPPRFLAEFENMLLSYADRTRIIADEHRQLVFTKNGIIHATVLLDGFVQGTWTIVRQRGTVTLNIIPFKPLSKQDCVSLEEEGTRLLNFAANDADTHNIRFVPPE